MGIGNVILFVYTAEFLGALSLQGNYSMEYFPNSLKQRILRASNGMTQVQKAGLFFHSKVLSNSR
jgi:hypothetical protein